MNSASELQFHLLLAHDLNFLDHNSYTEMDELVVEVKRMLTGFLRTLSES